MKPSPIDAEILSVETDLYGKPEPSSEEFFDYGEGLFIKGGEWYEIDEKPRRPNKRRNRKSSTGYGNG
jgi:hypothetical protein